MHLFHLDEVYSFFVGGFGFTVASYAAQSFPKPTNPYGLWILGVVQYVLANRDLGKANFTELKIQQLKAQP